MELPSATFQHYSSTIDYIPHAASLTRSPGLFWFINMGFDYGKQTELENKYLKIFWYLLLLFIPIFKNDPFLIESNVL